MNETIAYKKPTSLYETFDRKGSGETCTHYCPGCGHGTIQKLIAEAIDSLGIQDRTIFLSPVGCAVFAYYYYDTGNIQCSHGRAPAVATGVKRTRKDAVVISYQGDGDLAGIGMTEIMHAANRGEHITVFFVNNAIYGMTGGQMAPTTPLGLKTLTTPFGRDYGRDGRPIGMAEVMNALVSPVYIERCSVSNPKDLLRTRKAITKALENQIEGKGFSFVEILSPCPTNWRMTPVDARHWIDTEMSRLFPVGLLRDTEETGLCAPHCVPWMDDSQLLAFLEGKKEPVIETGARVPGGTQRIQVAGFGGQGVLSAGELLATCGMNSSLSVTWLPSYGPEMRGGSAHVSVILSVAPVGSPLVERPDVLLAMSTPALDHFEPLMAPGGLVITNSSIVNRPLRRSDLHHVAIPATAMAKEENLVSAANVVMIASYILISRIFDLDTLRRCIPMVLRKKDLLKKNIALVDKAATYVQEYL